MVEDKAFGNKIDNVEICLGESKYQRSLKSLHWVKSYGDFSERGDFT